jgi:hypothetical protein
MTIRALHQPLFDFVMEGHVELRLGVSVALVAELRLCDGEQLLTHGAVMNAVTTDAAHVVFTVRRALEISVLALMAAQTACIYFLRRCFGWIEDLGHISAGIYVCFAGSVTTFAGNTGLAVHLSEFRVRIRREPFGNFVVASCTGILPHKVTGSRNGLAGFRFCAIRGGRCDRRGYAEDQGNRKQKWKD